MTLIDETTSTQAECILAHMRGGKSITPLEALRLYGCFRLGARIYDLKHEGIDVKSEIVRDPVTKKHFSRYWL